MNELDKALSEIDSYLQEDQEQPADDKEPKTSPDGKGVQLTGPTGPSKGKSLKLSMPGSITMLLVFILFLVFAISPAYPGATQTRLQLLLAVILRGGSMRDPSVTGSMQMQSGLPDNGTSGMDYTFTPIFNMGTYSGGALDG